MPENKVAVVNSGVAAQSLSGASTWGVRMVRAAVLPCLMFALLGSVMPAAIAAPDTATANAELIGLVQRHVEAQRDFDQTTLRAITAENYVEISPVGEVDNREKMLTFYAPTERRAAPTVRVDEQAVQTFDQTAIVLARLTYTMAADGQPRSFAMRASYVARRLDGKWQLVSAHYTGIRPPKK
jgi:ketosteroid isomerase-like protein